MSAGCHLVCLVSLANLAHCIVITRTRLVAIINHIFFNGSTCNSRRGDEKKNVFKLLLNQERMSFMNAVFPVFTPTFAHKTVQICTYLYKGVYSKRIQLRLSRTKGLKTVNVRYILHCIPRAGGASEPGPGCCSSYR